MSKKIWMTSEGYQKVQTQLETLRTEKRPDMIRVLQDVSSDADWRENSQRILLQNELEILNTEINKLAEILDASEIVAPQNHDTTVDIGETVVLQTDDDVETYTIVSPSESAPDKGLISYESPVGHSLLNHKVGDEITVKVPVGLLHYRIVAVG